MRNHLIGAAIAALVAAAPSAAQSRPQTHDGFTVSVGLGGGSAGVSCVECESSRERAPTVYLRLGGAVRPNLVLAGEINGWSKSESDQGIDATITIVTINAVAQWYPQTATGFFVSGGVGLGSMEAKANAFGESLSDRTHGLGYQIGTGYDLRVRPNLAITPFVTYFATAGGKVESTGEKANANVVHFGLGVTWP